ncbi:hypothetical protein BJV82DRAFT_698107 [Fennellomyces sp. T-0311]|nr:hypothetical protein BJV82DRAFT_698107 [Fennellomyces sp. T-0311]
MCRNLQSFEYCNQSSVRNRNLRGFLGFPETSTVTNLSLAVNHTSPARFGRYAAFLPQPAALGPDLFHEVPNFTSLFTDYCATIESLNLFMLPRLKSLLSLSTVIEFSNLQYINSHMMATI